jgi:hypothetical protein
MSVGYEKLKKAVIEDCEKDGGNCFNENGCNQEKCKCSGRRCDKFKWIIDRAKHYEEKTGLSWEKILDAWEKKRDYWYVNYYQDSNQPLIESDKVRVFDTVDDLLKSVGKEGFICPACGGISTDPYTCNSGKKMSNGKVCDWKVYGLFGDLGKGVHIYCKDKLGGDNIFMPVKWVKEKEENKSVK